MKKLVVILLILLVLPISYSKTIEIPEVSEGGIGATNIMGKKSGEVTLFNLFKESFRQNPDYVLVGKVNPVTTGIWNPAKRLS